MALAKSKGKEVMVRGQAAVATAYEETNLAQYETGQGFEETDTDAYAIPRLYMLQSGSPQVKKKGGEYVEGAEEGMIFDTVLAECFPMIYVVPCLYRKTYTEWQPDRGGFAGEHAVENPSWVPRPKGGWEDPATGNEINDTRSMFLLYSPSINKRTGIPDNPQPAILSGTSTAIKAIRNWMSQMGRKVPPGGSKPIAMYYNIFKVASKFQENDEGSWNTWVFEDTGKLLPPASEVAERAKAFHGQVEAGTVQAPPQAPPADNLDESTGM